VAASLSAQVGFQVDMFAAHTYDYEGLTGQAGLAMPVPKVPPK